MKLTMPVAGSSAPGRLIVMSIPVSPVGSALSQAMPHGMHITFE